MVRLGLSSMRQRAKRIRGGEYQFRKRFPKCIMALLKGNQPSHSSYMS